MTPITPQTFTDYRATGLVIAAAIMTGWALVVTLGLGAWYPGAGHLGVDALWVLLETLAYTGMFITAHDAMHGLVAPQHPRLNHVVGALAIGLFAAMPYRALREAHHHHHDHPSTERDPDYHEGRGGVIGWYLRFVWSYATWRQLIAMAIAFNVLHHGLGLSLGRLWVFWILPQVLSTVQLFVVGTWLPHREGGGPFEGDGPTRARSLRVPRWVSFLACYHFGYHFEHHAWPFVPWWRLPEARRRREASRAG